MAAARAAQEHAQGELRAAREAEHQVRVRANPNPNPSPNPNPNPNANANPNPNPNPSQSVQQGRQLQQGVEAAQASAAEREDEVAQLKTLVSRLDLAREELGGRLRESQQLLGAAQAERDALAEQHAAARKVTLTLALTLTLTLILTLALTLTLTLNRSPSPSTNPSPSPNPRPSPHPSSSSA